MIFEGKVWRYGDNVDTDVIIPARYLNITDADELAKHCMEDIDTSFTDNVRQGDIMVAGKNFGCGSSREHAPLVIKVSGISCMIADSFARIFYRNAINIGLPIIELGSAVERINNGDILKGDLSAGSIVNQTTGEEFKVQPLPGFIQDIAKAGGLINYVKGEPA
jgi:3-isopropylmalate/(R)-2-methylmalate dehydratase small subunit